MANQPTTWKGTVCEEHGFCLDTHVTTPLAKGMVEEADLVLVMEQSHMQTLQELYPRANRRVFLLGHFNAKVISQISDPNDEHLNDFEKCFRIIRQSCDQLVELIAAAG